MKSTLVALLLSASGFDVASAKPSDIGRNYVEVTPKTVRAHP
jgi:hypothetical protein